MTKSKVSASQFFSLLFLSVLSTVFMYISSPEITIAQTETLLRPIVMVVVSIVFSLPTYLVYRAFRKKGDISELCKKEPFIKMVALCYGIVYFIGALKSASRFDLFASSELFPGTDMTVFLVGIIFVCGALSILGIGALCRAGAIFTFIVILATSFVMISLWDEIDILNFTPLSGTSFSDFLSDSFLFTVQLTELGTVLIFIPQIEGELPRKFIIWLVLSAVAFIGVFFFVIGSLGAFADTQLFPTYASVTLAEFGVVRRLDALETAIWIFCVVEKISFYILISTQCFKTVLEKVTEKRICVFVSGAICAVLVCISDNVQRFGFLSDKTLTFVLYFACVVVLPIVIFLYVRRIKPNEKSSENY